VKMVTVGGVVSTIVPVRDTLTIGLSMSLEPIESVADLPPRGEVARVTARLHEPPGWMVMGRAPQLPWPTVKRVLLVPETFSDDTTRSPKPGLAKLMFCCGAGAD